MNTTNPIRPRTVTLIGKLLRPLSAEGVISVAELTEMLAQLKHLATKGTLMPPIEPRLLNQREASAQLGISLANWKRLEREGKLSIPRRMVGSSVRYRNTDVFKYILQDDEAA